MDDFIKKMLKLGAELDQSTDNVQCTMIINDAKLLCNQFVKKIQSLKSFDIALELEQMQRFDVGAWLDGVPSSDKDDDGDWISFEDLEEIIKKLKS